MSASIYEEELLLRYLHVVRHNLHVGQHVNSVYSCWVQWAKLNMNEYIRPITNLEIVQRRNRGAAGRSARLKPSNDSKASHSLTVYVLVIESTETQDTVVGANGQAVPVAASSDLHRVARQISGPLQQPRGKRGAL